MSESIKDVRSRRSMSRTIIFPMRFVFAAISELLFSIKEICLMLVPSFGRGRRNREFEKAGKDSQKVTRRRANVAVFRKGERDRKREIIEAERESRKFMNSSGAQAAEYRAGLNRRKLEYSRGEAVNHLAIVNARHRQAQAKEENSELSTKKRPK